MVHFHHVAINTPNLEHSIAFYKNAFNFQEYAQWDYNDKSIAMLSIPSGGFLELHQTAPKCFRNNWLWHISFAPDDIDACYYKAVACGAKEFRKPFSKTIYATPTHLTVRVAWLKGPYGETIELMKEMN